MKITWKKDMKFFGQATDLKGKPAARADFSGGVRAEHGTRRPARLRGHDDLHGPDRHARPPPPRPEGGRGRPARQRARAQAPDRRHRLLRQGHRHQPQGRQEGQTPRSSSASKASTSPTTSSRANSRSSARGRRTSTTSRTRRRGRLAPGNASARRTITPVADPGRGDAGAGRTTPIIGRNTATKPASRGLEAGGQGQGQGQGGRAPRLGAHPDQVPQRDAGPVRQRQGRRPDRDAQGRLLQGRRGDARQGRQRASEARPRRPPRRRLLPDRGHPPRRQRAPRGRRRTARPGTSSRPGRTSTPSRRTRRSRPTS